MGSADLDALDKVMLRYVTAARIAQDLLRQVLTQVAAYALVLMTDEKPSRRPEASIVMACSAAGRALEEIRALHVPTGAAHHHHHLCKAAEAMQWAFAAAERCAAPGASEGERDTLSRALRAANEHLRATARLLPGFEMVDFGRACCAAHAPAGPAAQAQ